MKRGIGVLLTLLVLVVGGYVAYAQGWIPSTTMVAWQAIWQGWSSGAAQDGVYSGVLEAAEVQVMSQVPARVVTVAVEEGDNVVSGEVLIQLDTTLLEKEIALAAAEVRLAEAQLALLRAGPRSEERARAEAEVRAARVAVEAAQQALADAQAVYEAAQDIWPDIIRAEIELAKARYRRDAALAQAQAADLLVDLWRRSAEQAYAGVTLTLPGGEQQRVPVPPEQLNEVNYQWNLASQRAWQAWTRYRQAEAAVKAAEAALAAARARLDDPARREPIVAAETALRQAEAALAAAKEQQAALDEAVSEEAIAAAEANVRRARAAHARLVAQRSLYVLTAPLNGRVVQRSVEPGEVAVPGVPLLEIADLTTLRLTIYVPEAELGRFTLGQEVYVWVDAFPQQPFEGQVVRIADEAEFTPKNVQTREERVILVYAVDVVVPNTEGMLKPGMPADVTLTAVPPPPLITDRNAQEEALYSGTLEARKVRVMPEVTAKVLELTVTEGDTVNAGEVLLRLEPGPLVQRVREAEAALDAAMARLAEVASQPVPAEVRLARAGVYQARAEVAAARTRLEAARAVLAKPVALENAIRQTEAQLAVLEQQLEEARARKKEAEVTRDFYRFAVTDEGRTRFAMAEKQVAAADASLQAVEAEIAGTRRLLTTLQQIREKPLALLAQVRQAEGELQVAQARLTAAESALAVAEAPARPEEIALAKADVARARAALALVQAQLARYTVVAPANGTVLSVDVRSGEVAQAGVTTLVIGDLSTLDLVIFVPTPELGRFNLGQRVDVLVDAYPGQVFPGQVVWIADEAEFTPKAVQVRSDRVQMVVRVKVRVPNPDGLLKAGMPADVRVRE